MTPLDSVALVARIDQLLGYQSGADQTESFRRVQETLQGTLTLCAALYGPSSPQASQLTKAADRAASGKWAIQAAYIRELLPILLGSLQAMKGDVEAGLVRNLERQAIGGVIGDMLALAKEALSDSSDGAKNVAAVLAAATYEDTLRRMGETLASVRGRPDLADVLAELKKAGVLQGAPFTTAQSYLKFRNDALHADWTKLNRAVVGSCIAFVEGLVLQHFS